MPSTSNSSAGATDGRRSVLVSGASFAGLATAYWLQRLGYCVTVVEVARSFRRGGTPVDIEGETIGILTRMGLMDAVRTKALPPRVFSFKNANNEDLGSIGPASHDEHDAGERYEIHRDDLLDILAGAIDGSVAMRFDCSVTDFEEGAGSIAVTFSDGGREEFALAFGCDGNRSTTRRLLFGEGEQFTYFMGGYFYLKVVPTLGLLPPNTSELFNAPGRMVMLNGYDDRTDIGFGFFTGGEIDYDRRDRAQLRRMIRDRFGDLGWKVPVMLAAVGDDDDFYFDRINQIRMPTWSRGRVALVGDAGYCVSPAAGLGGSMAIIGAGHLADALAEHPDDHDAAFRAYEDGLRPFVETVQERAAIDGLKMLCPTDDAALAERNRKLAHGEFDM